MSQKPKRKIITLCNAGKERSRMLAGALEKILEGSDWEVTARGTYGLGSDDKGVETKYGWTPPEGFVKLLKKRNMNFPQYQSQQLTEQEAREATYLIAVDPVIAERVKQAFPQYADKVVVALQAIDKSENPYPDYLKHSIPDAWGGHLSKKVMEALHSVKSRDERIKKVEEVLGEGLDDAIKDYVSVYDPEKSDPTDIKRIPHKLRDYSGHKLDSDEAYLEEADHHHRIAKNLHKRGYFK